MTLEEIVNNLKSAGQDYGQLFNNNPRMDATKQFGGRAINNINSAGEGYSQWQRLQDQNFGPNQSVIASGFMHPQKGLSKLADWFTNNVNTAAGLPDPNQQDEASMYAYGPNIDQQAESGLNLAGLLQTGAFASGAAPKSAGGTLGTFIGRNSTGWDATKAAEAEKLLNAGADPAQVWKDHLIGRMPDGKLFSEIDDSGASFNLNKAPLDAYGAQEMPIYDALNHKVLQKEYPDLNDISVIHFPSEQYNGASFDSKDRVMIFGHEAMNQGKSVSLHEIGHAIQEKEGWARGGSPSGYKTTIGVIDDLKQQLPFLKKEKSQLLDSFMNTYDESLQPKMQDLDRKISKYEDIIKNPDQNLSNIDELSRQYYRRLTGEAQARATQDRMNMNMQQRRDNYPLAGDKLSDIPLDQLINMYGDNGPSMAVSGYGNAKQIGDILDKKYGSKIDADISGSNKGLTLDKILIEKENRNQGLGSSFLKDLTQYADSSQQPMSLTAAGDFGGSKAKQIDLYKRFGFVENKGKNKDYSISNNMYRNPTQEQIINPNLNFELLNKHLSGQKLTPEEMALYEKNGGW